MRIAVLGANGRSGRVFVDRALQAGHYIRAGYFSGTGKEFDSLGNIEAVKCDGTSLSDVRNLVSGCDVVVSLVGHGPKTPSFMQTETIQNVINAVGDETIIISLTGTGVRLPGDKPSLIDRFLNFGIAKIDPSRIEDGKKHAEVLMSQAKKWVLIRVLKLTNSDAISYTLTNAGPAKLLTSRNEVADAILSVINEGRLNEAPIISRKR